MRRRTSQQYGQWEEACGDKTAVRLLGARGEVFNKFWVPRRSVGVRRAGCGLGSAFPHLPPLLSAC